jgi:hypothetical protein
MNQLMAHISRLIAKALRQFTISHELSAMSLIQEDICLKELT